MNKPYRLFYTSHWIGSTVRGGPRPELLLPQAIGDRCQRARHLRRAAIGWRHLAAKRTTPSSTTSWPMSKQNLCIDTTRVFATGFSFGGMITYSLSVNHQKDIRAAVGIAPANYNIYVPTKTHEPIAWMQTTGMGDGTCPWVNGTARPKARSTSPSSTRPTTGAPCRRPYRPGSKATIVCYDFRAAERSIPPRRARSTAGTRTLPMIPAAARTGFPQSPGSSSRSSSGCEASQS